MNIVTPKPLAIVERTCRGHAEYEEAEAISQGYRDWLKSAGQNLFDEAAAAGFPMLKHPSGLAVLNDFEWLCLSHCPLHHPYEIENIADLLRDYMRRRQQRQRNAADRRVPNRAKKGRRTQFRHADRRGSVLRPDFAPGRLSIDPSGERSMASIVRDGNGRYRLSFEHGGKRRSLRLGRCGRRAAEVARTHVEAIIASRRLGTSLPAATTAWLESLDAVLRRRLAACGLTDGPSDAPTLGEWCRQYIASRRSDAAERTLYRLQFTARLLAEYFGPDRRLDSISSYDAEQFSRWPRLGTALNAIRRRTGTAKQILGAAVKAGILDRNPFDGIAATTRPNRSRDYFIDRDTFARLLDACRDRELRAVLTLARIGGLPLPVRGDKSRMAARPMGRSQASCPMRQNVPLDRRSCPNRAAVSRTGRRAGRTVRRRRAGQPLRHYALA